MTETTKPPNRPTFKTSTRTFDREGPRGSDKPRGAEKQRDDKPRTGVKPRGEDRPRAGDKPRTRSGGDRPNTDRDDRRRDDGRRDDGRRDEGRRDPAAKTRGGEPAPQKDDARIAKVMARAGLCSRRDAEGWIAAGRVAVNGTVIDSPALNVKPGDSITVDGQPLPEREQTRLFMFHKPRGLVTTSRDPEGRPTIFDNLPEGLPRLVSVGRLDINTEGLMLLTNDGGLARVLELPATGWLRRYRVRANGAIDQPQLDALRSGVTIDGVDYAGIEATLDRVQGANAWLTMGLREGKNREIKRVLETLGLAVTRLIRVSYGPFQLGELAEGAVESVPTRVLRDQLGPALASQAGVDFEEREQPVLRRDARADGVAPSRPSRTEPAAARPHVSALRTSRSEEAGESRRRIERGATADRKGRAVKIERVIPVGAGSERGAESRNARRFASEKQDYVAGKQKTRADAGTARRGAFGERGSDGPVRPRRDDDTRPARAGFGDKPRGERAGGFGDKPRGERAGGFGDKPRGERAGGFGDKPRGERAGGFGDKARGERAGGFGDKARGERAGGVGDKPRGERAGGFGDKPRGERAAGFGDKPRSERAGGFGDKPRSERAAGFGDKPRSGKPNGRPGGFSSERPATGRNKPTGGGPAGGGKPRGGTSPSAGRPPRSRP